MSKYKSRSLFSFLDRQIFIFSHQTTETDSLSQTEVMPPTHIPVASSHSDTLKAGGHDGHLKYSLEQTLL